MNSNNFLTDLLTNLQRFILCAERIQGSSGLDKKEFVVSCLIGYIPEGEFKTLLSPLIPVLIDYSVNLMNSDRMLGIRKQCGCGG